jgi:hypothetical protein
MVLQSAHRSLTASGILTVVSPIPPSAGWVVIAPTLAVPATEHMPTEIEICDVFDDEDVWVDMSACVCY